MDNIEIDITKLRTTANVIKFINYHIDILRQHNISINLSSNDYVYFNMLRCGGYFDENNLTFAVGCGGQPEDWLPIFTHETCHVDQWLQNHNLFEAFCKTDITGLLPDDGPSRIFDDWLMHKLELSDESLNALIFAIISLELDCEKRAVEKIKIWNLPIDLDWYIQQSNQYLWSHWVMKLSRNWNSASLNEKIFSLLPTDFNQDYSCLPGNIFDIFLKYDKHFRNAYKNYGVIAA